MSKESLCLYVCNFFSFEIKKLIKEGDYPEVVVKDFFSTCTKSFSLCKEENIILEKLLDQHSKVVFIEGMCNYKNRDANIEFRKKHERLEVIQLNSCFEILVNKEIIDHYTSQGYYITSNGWLKNYKQHLKEWGFDSLSAKSFFKAAAFKILLLENGLTDNYLEQIKEFSELVGLPYEILPVGTGGAKFFLEKIVLGWRKENELKLFNEKLATVTRQVANQEVLFNELNKLIEVETEKEIIEKIFHLINLLMAPQNIKYTPFNNENLEDILYFNGPENFSKYNQNNGLILELFQAQWPLGSFEIVEVHYPKYLAEYRSIAKTIGIMGSLVVLNVRKFATIKENENKIANFSRQLKNEIDQKDKFFSIISHDLKNPFNGFLGITQLYAENSHLLSPSEIKNYGKEMHASAKNLYKLLNNLLDWSLMKKNLFAFTPEDCNVFDVVCEVIDLLNSFYSNKNIKVLNKTLSSQTILADRQMLNLILRNLLSNAVKFTPMEGEITIGFTIEANIKYFYVQDSGIGMGPEILENLFKIDQEVTRPGTEGETSTGLGLILCEEFVKKHGGRIWATSEKRKGSTFYFTLS